MLIKLMIIAAGMICALCLTAVMRGIDSDEAQELLEGE